MRHLGNFLAGAAIIAALFIAIVTWTWLSFAIGFWLFPRDMAGGVVGIIITVSGIGGACFAISEADEAL